jgi:hypothetical protein
VVRKLAFVLTKQPARTCLSGAWYVAQVISEPKGYTHNPAYSFAHGRLEVLLANGPCDNYNSYIGKLTHRAFKGSHVMYGLGFSKSVGQVTGTYVSP